MTTSAGLRVLLWLGTLLLLALGLPLTGAGLLGLGTPLGRGLLCAGLVLLIGGLGGLAREVVERREPPRPRLASLDGEPALHLPRAAGPTLVSSWSLAALGAVALLGSFFTGREGRWGWCVLLLLVAGSLLWSSAVHRGGGFAGGLWFTPSRLRHVDRGAVVDLPWESVTGVVPQQPMPVLVRPDHPPAVTRTGPRGRAWNPVRDGTLVVDTRHLAGGAPLASYVIAKAVTEPASRGVLGSEESLPPS